MCRPTLTTGVEPKQGTMSHKHFHPLLTIQGVCEWKKNTCLFKIWVILPAPHWITFVIVILEVSALALNCLWDTAMSRFNLTHLERAVKSAGSQTCFGLAWRGNYPFGVRAGTICPHSKLANRDTVTIGSFNRMGLEQSLQCCEVLVQLCNGLDHAARKET